MKYYLDLSYWAWKVHSGRQYGKTEWFATDELMKNYDVTMCADSKYSIRKEAIANYKANRANPSPDVMRMRKEINLWIDKAIQRYENVKQVRGLEADDLLVLYAGHTEGIISEDKDLLQTNYIKLVDNGMNEWGIDRVQKKTKLSLARGERWLTYQLLMGDVADNIKRSIPTKDRAIAPWCFNQKSPLRAALSIITEDTARNSLNLLLLPTPLWSGKDAIETALETYPE